jgi:hypothetical protein
MSGNASYPASRQAFIWKGGIFASAAFAHHDGRSPLFGNLQPTAFTISAKVSPSGVNPGRDAVLVGEGRLSTSFLAVIAKDVDGGPSPTMTGTAKPESKPYRRPVLCQRHCRMTGADPKLPFRHGSGNASDRGCKQALVS